MLLLVVEWLRAAHHEAMVGQRWRHWAAVVAVVVGLAVVGVTLTALWRYATRDRPDVVDQPIVVRTTNVACLVMRKTVHELAPPPEAPIAARLAAVEAQNVAVADMLSRIRALGPEQVTGDAPLTSWLSDWESLLRVREVYAASLRAGKPKPLRVPTDAEGEPITTRMNDVGLDCTVPLELTRGG
jgi:hypothetical protein